MRVVHAGGYVALGPFQVRARRRDSAARRASMAFLLLLVDAPSTRKRKGVGAAASDSMALPSATPG